MIHIVFGKAEAEVLHAAIQLDETLKGEIVVIKDEYEFGPLENIYEAEGRKFRNEWWKMMLEGGDFEGNLQKEGEGDDDEMASLINILNENENELVWVWAAQNSHDVCGYYWLLPFMKAFYGRVFILYLNNLPFFNEKGNIFYPTSLKEIPPKEFLKAKKLAREITLSEFEVDPDEWTKVCNENKGVRILEGGKKLLQVDYHFMDTDLKKYIMPDWQKAQKIISNFLSKSKHVISESYLLWRLKVMIAMDVFDVQGKVEKMKDFEIKYKSKES